MHPVTYMRIRELNYAVVGVLYFVHIIKQFHINKLIHTSSMRGEPTVPSFNCDSIRSGIN